MKLRLALAALALALVAIQLVPVDRTNPPVTGDIQAPEDVKVALRRACYDCHSHETKWPWYGHVAPFSWMVAAPVHRGRAALNFSRWDDYTTREQIERWKESWKNVEGGRMAPWFYLPIHHDAVFTDAEERRVRIWALGSAHFAEEDLRAPAPAP